MGLIWSLLASEAAVEALVTIMDRLNDFDWGKEGFELIRFKPGKSKDGIFRCWNDDFNPIESADSIDAASSFFLDC